MALKRHFLGLSWFILALTRHIQKPQQVLINEYVNKSTAQYSAEERGSEMKNLFKGILSKLSLTTHGGVLR